jgi:hypothetical protein
MKACTRVFGHPDSHFINIYMEQNILLPKVIYNTEILILQPIYISVGFVAEGIIKFSFSSVQSSRLFMHFLRQTQNSALTEKAPDLLCSVYIC